LNKKEKTTVMDRGFLFQGNEIALLQTKRFRIERREGTRRASKPVDKTEQARGPLLADVPKEPALTLNVCVPA